MAKTQWKELTTENRSTPEIPEGTTPPKIKIIRRGNIKREHKPTTPEEYKAIRSRAIASKESLESDDRGDEYRVYEEDKATQADGS
jgi:hypothetical protein